MVFGRSAASCYAHTMSRSRYKFHEAEYPYFFTGTIVGWLSVFARIKKGLKRGRAPF